MDISKAVDGTLVFESEFAVDTGDVEFMKRLFTDSAQSLVRFTSWRRRSDGVIIGTYTGAWNRVLGDGLMIYAISETRTGVMERRFFPGNIRASMQSMWTFTRMGRSRVIARNVTRLNPSGTPWFVPVRFLAKRCIQKTMRKMRSRVMVENLTAFL